ncbi:tetratricopeptide repeat protein [Microscilla marina]|uniref:Putative ggdef family protein n=1 Tax=Microscilla marina ATCC 23134 TaxID=313606 RepID=A1ZSY2_MICM2|nr:tetratricopeptide repeat protein [Microscilla marina]EAY26546.1 putative ggdef family protein [Microscilla marina ATCC 23134]
MLLLKSTLTIIISLFAAGFTLSAQPAKPAPYATINALKNRLTTAKEDRLKVNILNQLAQLHLKHAPDTTFKYARQALQLSQTLDYPQAQAASRYYLGKVFYSYGSFNQAIGQYMQALPLYRTQPKGQAQVYNALGQTHYYANQTAAALKCHQQALQWYKKLADPKGEAVSLGYLGHIYEKKANYVQALDYQQRALKIYEALDDKTGLSQIYDHLGSIYEDQHQYEQAHHYFSKALALNQKLNNQLDMILNYNDLGDVYRKQGNYTQALKFTQAAYDLAKKLHHKYQQRSALRDLAKTHKHLNNYQKAHELLDRSYKLYTEIYDRTSARQLAHAQALYEASQKEKQIALLEKDKKIALIYRTLLGGGALILFLIAWVVFRQQKLKLRSNREIIEQNQRIYETRQALVNTELHNAQLNEQKLKTELENKLLKEQQLQSQLEAKSKELTSHALHVIQKNKMLEELKDKLRTLKQQHKKGELTDVGKQIQQVINRINYSFSQDKDWKDFKKVFEEVHQDFFVKLQRQHPGLTPAETRLCALLKLNLSSKDISTIMGISTDSLRIARYRLRKKLQLPKEVKLHNFVTKIV